MSKKRAPVRPKLNATKIAQAAIKLADERGIDALSMRTTAAELGVQAMFLYNHVKNKDQLLDEMVDAVIAEIELPADDSKIMWQDFYGCAVVQPMPCCRNTISWSVIIVTHEYWAKYAQVY